MNGNYDRNNADFQKGVQGGRFYGAPMRASDYDSVPRQPSENYSQTDNFTNNEPDYDPNAPLYNPADDEPYDPNMSLYHPDENAQAFYTSQKTAVRPVVKSDNKKIIITALSILSAVIVGVAAFFIIKSVTTRSLKDFVNTPEGRNEILLLQQELDKDQSQDYTSTTYVNDNNQLVVEYKFVRYKSIAQSEQQAMKEYLDTYMAGNKHEIAGIIDKTMRYYRVREFSVLYNYVNGDGSVICQYEVKKND